MLKSTTLHLPGRDAYQPNDVPDFPTSDPVILTELPALVADRYARVALAAIGAPTEGGVISLAMQHLPDVLRLGQDAVALLEPFVRVSRPIRVWTNILTVQQAALALHTGFIVARPRLEIPVSMQADAIRKSHGDLSVHFCSPHIATVLHSGRATYRELETVLSTEDVFNLVELVNVEAVREWRAHQPAGNPRA